MHRISVSLHARRGLRQVQEGTPAPHLAAMSLPKGALAHKPEEVTSPGADVPKKGTDSMVIWGAEPA